MQQSVLLVGKESHRLSELKQILQTSCFVVQEAPVAGIVRTVLVSVPALLLFSVTSWNKETRDVLWELQSLNGTRPIRKVVLVDRSEPGDSVSALDGGADDYLVQPLSDRELIARLRSVLRSSSQSPSVHPRIAAAPDWLHRDSLEVSLGSGRMKLGKREFALLAYLSERTGKVVSREELLENLWYPADEISDLHSIDVCIFRLREKIEDDPARPTRLLTRRGEGYVLVDSRASFR